MEKIWPDRYEQANSFWTSRYPRPEKDGPHHPAMLETLQAEWDEAEAKRQVHLAKVEKIQADKAHEAQAKRDAAAAQEEERRQAKNAETEQMLYRRFISAGGSQAEWEQERADILVEHRRRLVSQGDVTEQQKRQAQAALYQNF